MSVQSIFLLQYIHHSWNKIPFKKEIRITEMLIIFYNELQKSKLTVMSVLSSDRYRLMKAKIEFDTKATFAEQS